MKTGDMTFTSSQSDEQPWLLVAPLLASCGTLPTRHARYRLRLCRGSTKRSPVSPHLASRPPISQRRTWEWSRAIARQARRSHPRRPNPCVLVTGGEKGGLAGVWLLGPAAHVVAGCTREQGWTRSNRLCRLLPAPVRLTLCTDHGDHGPGAHARAHPRKPTSSCRIRRHGIVYAVRMRVPRAPRPGARLRTETRRGQLNCKEGSKRLAPRTSPSAFGFLPFYRAVPRTDAHDTLLRCALLKGAGERLQRHPRGRIDHACDGRLPPKHRSHHEPPARDCRERKSPQSHPCACTTIPREREGREGAGRETERFRERLRERERP